MKYIYLDHNATTPLHPDVLAAMLPFFAEKFANPASITHPPGREARDMVEQARGEIAAFIGAEPAEIVFTSGATEADNMAVKGAAWAHRDRGDHIVASAVEHKAVLDSCRWLEKNGFRLTVLPVDRWGLVGPDDVDRAITDRTILVSVMHANSEVGTVQPVEEIARICRQRGVLYHCDATQTVGKIPFHASAIGCDLAAFSGHKFYGPKGIGGLFVRRRVRLDPLMTGGGQERGRRSGTVNVPGVIGLAEACRIAQRDMGLESARLLALRQRLHDGIVATVEGTHLNGHPVRRLPNNLNFSFEAIEGEALILAMRSVALSSGSACTSGESGPSYVLKAMGVPDDLAHSSLRFGLGRSNDADQIDAVVTSLGAAVRKLRAMSPKV
ncbi:MAG: cysteine desulfurase NifS [Acidobacteria bacterium]|nr:MAG: cysteine desulfurase NifS [Acidobacteriota bacterium]